MKGTTRKTRKATAYWSTLVVLTLLFVVSALTNQLAVVGQALVGAFVGNTMIYIGGNVADNWQRSKYFQEGLVDK